MVRPKGLTRGSVGEEHGKLLSYKKTEMSNESLPVEADENRLKDSLVPMSSSCSTALGELILKNCDVDGLKLRAMIDTGSCVTLIHRKVVKQRVNYEDKLSLQSVSGEVLQMVGSVEIGSISIDGYDLGTIRAYVIDKLPRDVDLLVGNDVLFKTGLLVKPKKDKVGIIFGCNAIPGRNSESEEIMKIEKNDFLAWFDGKQWFAKWKWKHENPIGKVQTENFGIPTKDRKKFDDEIKQWIEDGILVKYNLKEHGEIKNIIPMMSVKQLKGDVEKIRPVLDYRFLNDQILSYPGNEQYSCQNSLRKWRMMGPNCASIDLTKAYLQIGVDRSLWKYQVVEWKGERYVMTKLGFGLNVAPKIMTHIVERIINENSQIDAKSYIDDIFINESSMSAEKVNDHFEKFGLKSKPIERLGSIEGVRLLGLKVGNDFRWKRDRQCTRVVKERMTKRGVYGLIGEWVSHVPVAGWLRVASAYVQRMMSRLKLEWDELVPCDIMEKLEEISEKIISEGDPARGNWLVDKTGDVIVWTDASSLAFGVNICVNDETIEDAAWLRKENDSSHINISELDAALRGINMAINWGFSRFRLMVDSATVYGWLRSVFIGNQRVKTRAMSEHIVRRRLDILRELKEQENLDVVVELVKSSFNKADILTRVPKSWIKRTPKELTTVCAVSKTPMYDEVKKIHDRCHFGKERMFELVGDWFGESRSAKRLIKKVIDDCYQCAKICPAIRFKYNHGVLSSSRVWDKVYGDITHVGKTVYLTMVDSASKFCIWRKLNNASMNEVSDQIESVFSEFGAPRQFLSDNGTNFRNIKVSELCKNWDVQQDFTCAYRPQGNGICERSHRTIKTMRARSGRSISECLLWYNGTKGKAGRSPYSLMFHARSRLPGVRDYREPHCEVFNEEDERDEYPDHSKNPFNVGDRVFLRSSGRCDDPWSGPHTITSLKSSVGVEINEDGITRHVSHVRLVPLHGNKDGEDDFSFSSSSSSSECGGYGGDEDESSDQEQFENEPKDKCKQIERRSQRKRREPAWMQDYMMSD